MKRNFRRICVFCGSSTGENAAYREATEELGRELAARRIELVYGGGSVGLMGVLADAALAAGGAVIGVIPEMLASKELAHSRLTAMHVVSGMHARKALMAELADAFLALPGGFGTYEELFEVITWAQLGIHAKPIGVLDVAGYFEPFVRLVENGVVAGFIRPEFRPLICRADRAGAVLDALATHEIPSVEKWITREQA